MIRAVRSTQDRRASMIGVPSSRCSRSGFSLVELIVAIALFGVSMSAIGALTLAVSRQSSAGAGTIGRTASLEARANDLFSIPWAQINGRVGCITITTAPFPRTECITSTTTAATRRRVTLTVTPADASIRATSVTVERTQPPAINPFRNIP